MKKWRIYLSGAIAAIILSLGYYMFSSNENLANGEESHDSADGGLAKEDQEKTDGAPDKDSSDLQDGTAGNNSEEPGVIVNEMQAKEITNELLTGLTETFKQLGTDYKWTSIKDSEYFPDYTEPDYAIAKPYFLNFATEEFSDSTLQNILMDFYCHCDTRQPIPALDFNVRSEIIESKENLFVIKSISIVNELGNGGYTGYITVKYLDGAWKIDNWETVSYRDEPINITSEEYINYLNSGGYGYNYKFIETIQMPASDQSVKGNVDVHVFYSGREDIYYGIEANSTKFVRPSGY
ncbi:hypothetical protein SAMN05877753_101612 [Bacillus oleivorans]|uniref:Uncharacterized protein n=1 Tax=Bacillus oleivorans TaxID=1448271 RepID=A0A285CJW1_9BACI|nr:hypothetical protein [Bacillus oleivorans]SNX67293.1 hypothetical protein SAMN05877753_101612 [Bacillus oleivorans]